MFPITSLLFLLLLASGCPALKETPPVSTFKFLLEVNCRGCNPAHESENAPEAKGEQLSEEGEPKPPPEGEDQPLIEEGEQEKPPEGEAYKEWGLVLPGDIPLALVWIPADTFMMGRHPGEQDSFDWEDHNGNAGVLSGQA